jgi:mono/diheme cytochrome c family protein
MKTKIKLTVLTVGLAMGATGTLVHGSDQKAPSAELANPRKLYIQNCASCHGSSGISTRKGKAIFAPDLKGTGKSPATIERIIRNGRDDMPGFGKKLNSKQIAQLAGYVKSL